MNTAAIITASERMLTLSKRAAISNEPDTSRNALLSTFGKMATDIGKIASSFRAPNWSNIDLQSAIYRLHTEAVHADEHRSGTFVHVPSEMALVTALHGLSACLGFVVSDAATAQTDEHDEAAMAAVEMRQEAAE